MGRWTADTAGVGRRSAIAVAVATLATAPLFTPGIAHAQKVSVDSGVSTELSYTSNGNLGLTGEPARSDTVLDVRPHISIRTQGSRFRVGGSASLQAITSANGTQPSRILPEGQLDGRFDAVPNLFFIDAGVRAAQTGENPFDVRPEVGTTRNTITTAQGRLSPSVEGSINSDTRYRLRSENTWTRDNGAVSTATSLAEGYFGRHAAAFEHDPRPLGYRLELERNETRYRDDVTPRLLDDIARVSMDYAFGNELSAGLRAGREHNNVVLSDRIRTIYGAQMRWRPSPRTTLVAQDERRFFGHAWQLGFEQHASRVSFSVNLSRSLDTAPQSLLDRAPVQDFAATLDAMFAARFPDPIERARAVQDFITQQGLLGQTIGVTDIFARRLSVVTHEAATVALLGTRTTLTMNVFQTRTEDVSETTVLATGTPLTNNVQVGASAQVGHRLTPLTSFSSSVEWRRIRAIAASDTSIERTARVQVTTQLAPRTNAFAGARYRSLGSNVVSTGREGAVFAGLDHRF